MKTASSTQKIFVSGVTGNLTQATVENYFSTLFHEPFTCTIPSHPVHSTFNKGYAILSTPSAASKKEILRNKKFMIGERLVHVMDYLSKSDLKLQQEDLKKRRVFVCSKLLSQIDLWAAFARFGEVEDAYVIRDLKTKKYLNYGFVLF